MWANIHVETSILIVLLRSTGKDYSHIKFLDDPFLEVIDKTVGLLNFV